MTVIQEKKEIIDYIYRYSELLPTSFVDLGGVWGVDGEYAFYTLQKYVLFDTPSLFTLIKIN